MSKDLKDLIDSVEKETKSQAELEHIIHSLKEEINRLEFTTNEQELLIETLKSQMKNDDLEQAKLPSEIDVLKDIITSQRKELDNKDKLIDNLNDKMFELSSGSDNDDNRINEEFINAQKLIVQLTDDNESYKNQIEQLQTQIDEIRIGKSDDEDWLDDAPRAKENEELINFKKLNFQLMEENGLLRVEIESLKSKFQERLEETISKELASANEINVDLSLELESLKMQLQEHMDSRSEELKLANDKISMLTSEIEDYKAQLEYLNGKLEESIEPVIITSEDALRLTEMKEELDNVKSELLKSQKDNQALTEKLNELKMKLSTEEIEKIEVDDNLPERLNLSLFYRMYNLLDENKKYKVINSLIQDLQSNNNEIKRNAIRILSAIKNDKVYDAFIQMLNDKDWLVRYSVIKALSKFEKKSEELKPILKDLTRDNDVDVRELALRILDDLSL